MHSIRTVRRTPARSCRQDRDAASYPVSRPTCAIACGCDVTAAVLEQFTSDVGGLAAGPVVAVGGRTQFDVGGAVDPAVREVRAPAGIVEHEPAEMTVRVRAGTAVAALDDSLGEHGQCVA